ncbi:MAG: hypothetical protein HC838_12010 [Spirulinaceae cyanobacterium RM2_2_10]|nr:hypothetical protein [Spirulinaceae cyanobacterium SM2_1_0]NJO20613.1 hypothetical protein [Spirulinaceae cyanobacterium RM2_2_10]
MAQITIEIPDELAQRLTPLQAQLPQFLELGLQKFQAWQRATTCLDEREFDEN